MSKYKSVMLTRKGSPEVLQVVESDLRDPAPGEARIKLQATGVGRTDVVMRTGYYPYAPRIPFRLASLTSETTACLTIPTWSVETLHAP